MDKPLFMTMQFPECSLCWNTLGMDCCLTGSWEQTEFVESLDPADVNVTQGFFDINSFFVFFL